MRVSAIIYGEETGIVRRIVVSDSLEELARATILVPGEAIKILDTEEVLPKGAPLPDLAACTAIVEMERGKPSESGRVVVIDEKSGDIVDVIMADPAIDVLPEKTLFQDDKAVVGWIPDGKGEFVDPAVAAEIAV